MNGCDLNNCTVGLIAARSKLCHTHVFPQKIVRGRVDFPVRYAMPIADLGQSLGDDGDDG